MPLQRFNAMFTLNGARRLMAVVFVRAKARLYLRANNSSAILSTFVSMRDRRAVIRIARLNHDV
ncbi:MAG TPA: hypothetical protein PLD46_03325 [Hyphomicrobium sp.]|nr:hypothetical protein [Hyphomicrobium sp.]